MKKQITIPFKYYTGIGGPTTFLNNLKNYLGQEDIPYATNVKIASSLFFPVNFNHQVLKRIKKRGGRLIQRLDGIYYPSKHGTEYVEFNKDIKKAYLDFTDFVVFQSEYSKAQCFQMLGEKDADEYTIITNGVNKKIFYANPKRQPNTKFIFTTTGNFRNLDMLEPVILALDAMKNDFKFELQVIGPIKNEQLKPLLTRSYINHLGTKNAQEIAPFLRESDAFIYSHLNPPCPNSVLEAISTGLPIVGFDSGAMKELCYFSTDLLAPVSTAIFQKYEDFDAQKLGQKLRLVMTNYAHFRNLALAHTHLFPFEECGRKYVEIFEKELQKVVLKPSLWDKIIANF